jgi:hypothetical protein
MVHMAELWIELKISWRRSKLVVFFGENSRTANMKSRGGGFLNTFKLDTFARYLWLPERIMRIKLNL